MIKNDKDGFESQRKNCSFMVTTGDRRREGLGKEDLRVKQELH